MNHSPIAFLVLAACVQASFSPAAMASTHEAAAPLLRDDKPAVLPSGAGWRELTHGSGYVRTFDVADVAKKGGKHPKK